MLPLHSCSCMCTHAHTHARAHTNTHTHTDECVFDHGLLCFQMCGTSTYHTCILSFLSSVFYFYSVSITFLSLVFYFYSKYHIPFIGVLLCVTFLSSVFYSVSHCFHQCFTSALCYISFISVLLCITLHACVCCCFYTGVVSMLYCGSFQFTCRPITCVCSHTV